MAFKILMINYLSSCVSLTFSVLILLKKHILSYQIDLLLYAVVESLTKSNIDPSETILQFNWINIFIPWIHDMAAYLNRGMSMVNASMGYESLVDSNKQHHNVNSPLQIFVKAKKNINEIFGDINDYVIETTNFIEGKWNRMYPSDRHSNVLSSF